MCIFGVIRNYIVVYIVFSFRLSELIQDTLFDPFYLSIIIDQRQKVIIDYKNYRFLTSLL